MSGKLKNIGESMGRIGSSLTRSLTLPIIAAGTAAFKMYKDFDFSMQQIVGLVGVAQDQVNAWREDVLKMGSALGKGPKELADAMFFVTSAGLRGKEAMDVLEKSAKASASGLGETKIVADLLTSAINAYGAENLSAAQATDILVAAVREGKAEASEMAGTLGAVLPIASEMGVTFDQVAASVAAMTRTGTNAATASMQLKNILVGLLKPTKQAEEALSMMGTSSQELREQIKEKGLLSVLMRLKDLTNEYGEDIMAHIFPNIRSLMGVLDLMGANMEENVKIFDALTDATGALDHAFETASQTAEFKWQQTLATIQVLMITLGDAVQKAVIPVMEDFVKWLRKVIDWFKNLSPEVQSNIIRWLAYAAALGPILIIFSKLIGLFRGILSGLALLKAGLVALTTASTASTTAMAGLIGAKGIGGVTVAAGGAWQALGLYGAKTTALGSSLTGLLGPIALVVAAIGLLGYTFYKEWLVAKEHSERGAKHIEESLIAVKQVYSETYKGIEVAQQKSNLAKIDEEIAYFATLEKLTKEQTARLEELHGERVAAIESIERNSRFDRMVEEINFGYAVAKATKKDNQEVVGLFDSFSENYMDAVRKHHYTDKMEQIRHLYETGKIDAKRAGEMIKNVNDTWEKGIIPATNASMAVWLHDQGISLQALGLMYDKETGKIVEITKEHLNDHFKYMVETQTIISFDAWALIGAKGAEGLISAEGKIFYSADALAKAAIKGLDVPGYNIGMKWGSDINAGLNSQLPMLMNTARMMTAQVRAAFGDVTGVSRSWQPASGWNPYRGYDDGGVVPGLRGKPQLAVVHGGETILPTHKTSLPNIDLAGRQDADVDIKPGQMILAVMDNRIWRQMERSLRGVRIAEGKRGVG